MLITSETALIGVRPFARIEQRIRHRPGAPPIQWNAHERPRNGFQIVGEFYDAAVSGADAIKSRPGFSELLDRIEGNHVRTVIVEDASRSARVAQELGITLLISRGVRLLTANGDDLTASDDPSRKMMRQIAGAFAQYEKARLVHKLRHARERKKEATGKCEGRKSHKELRPEVVKEAKRLRRHAH